MARFDDCMRITVGIEGGVSNDPADHGGLTNYGVTQSTYDLFRRSNGLPQQPVTMITQGEICDLYKSRYWDAVQGDAMPDPVDMCMFDAAVNSGPGAAAKMLQRALGLSDDGVIGPQTLAAVAAADPDILARDALNEREDFYHAIVAHDPSQGRFITGWMNRLTKLRGLC